MSRARLRRPAVLPLLNLLAIVLVLAFIWGNSFFDQTESAQISGSVTEIIEPVVRPVVEFVANRDLSHNEFHHFVRKAAHFSEYALLGALCLLYAFQVRSRLIGSFLLPTVLFPSAVALIDEEIIQRFCSRGNSLRDVLLDSCGALFGIAFCAALIALIRALVRGRAGRSSRS